MAKLKTEINAETDRKLTRRASRIGISKDEAIKIIATKGPDHFRALSAAKRTTKTRGKKFVEISEKTYRNLSALADKNGYASIGELLTDFANTFRHDRQWATIIRKVGAIVRP